jgi:hypothetical protein
MQEDLKRKIVQILPQTFEPEINLEDIEQEMSYKKGMPPRPTLHIGQRKLLLSEIQFLTLNLESKNDEAFVVYAGAAPSNHIYLLRELFPNVKFLLVDPNEFLIYMPDRNFNNYSPGNEVIYLKADPIYSSGGKKINYFNGKTVEWIDMKKADELKPNYLDFIFSDDHRIYLIEDLFTDQLAEDISTIDISIPCFFFSDIRTNVYSMIDDLRENGVEETILKKISRHPGDLDLLWNLSQQFNWVNILSFNSYLLKFRAPFFDQDGIEIINILSEYEPFSSSFNLSREFGLDLIEDYVNRRFRYLDGEVFIQCWMSESSTETKLIGNRTLIKEFNQVEYENKLFFRNNVTRPYAFHINELALKEFSFDHCGDCSIEASIWTDYFEKNNLKININIFRDLLQRVQASSGGRTLKRDGHGDLFKHLTLDDVKRMMIQASKKSKSYEVE